jgi:hypothetical protein
VDNIGDNNGKLFNIVEKFFNVSRETQRKYFSPNVDNFVEKVEKFLYIKNK